MQQIPTILPGYDLRHPGRKREESLDAAAAAAAVTTATLTAAVAAVTVL